MGGEVRKRIALDRRVCIVGSAKIEVRPARSALAGPFLGLLIGGGLIAAVALFADRLPVAALTAMLIPGMILAPLSAMGLVYSLAGASLVIETSKQSARFQQGMLGLGLGTVELVPFWKIERLELEDAQMEVDSASHLPTVLDFRGWDIVLVKKSGKRLPMGQVLSPNVPELIDESFGRALEAAEAMARLVDKPLVVTAAVEEVVEEQATEGQRAGSAGLGGSLEGVQ